MRKITIILILVTALIFAGCQSQANQTNATESTPGQSAEPLYTQTVTVQSDFRLPESLEDLVNVQSYNIFVGTVEKILPAERISMKDIDAKNTEDMYMNFTPVRVKVIKAIRGSIKDNMSLNVSLHGGTAGGVKQTDEGEYGLEEGKTYLLFVSGKDTSKKHCYQLGVPFAPNPQIVDGKLVDYAEEYFFLPDGLTIDEITKRILEVAE